MEERVLNRATGIIDRNDFLVLIQMHMKHEWLQQRGEALFDLWCMAESEEQKKLIVNLIENYMYVDWQKLDYGCCDIAKQIEETWGLQSNNTIISATCDNSNPDGSQMLIQNLKNKFSDKWREGMFYNSLPVAVNKLESNNNIVIIDDFIGTGDTILKKVSYIAKEIDNREINNCSIYLVALAAMEFSKTQLNQLDINYYSVYWLKKGISEQIPISNRDNAIKAMEDLEAKLNEKIGGRTLPTFGYKKSESLFAIESINVPNNVFPIFWWKQLKDGTTRKTFFNRV